MKLKNLLFILLSCLVINSSYATRRKQSHQNACKTSGSCLNDKNCQCYCSRVCHMRDKEADDKPVFMVDDAAGHNCYCKQWDADAYQNNCSAQEKSVTPKSRSSRSNKKPAVMPAPEMDTMETQEAIILR